MSREGLEGVGFSGVKAVDLKEGGAFSGAFENELRELAEAWPSLKASVRADVLALVHSNVRSRPEATSKGDGAHSLPASAEPPNPARPPVRCEAAQIAPSPLMEGVAGGRRGGGGNLPQGGRATRRKIASGDSTTQPARLRFFEHGTAALQAGVTPTGSEGGTTGLQEGED